MRCGKARKDLSDALDGSLRPGRTARVEAHLKACPACRAYRQGLVRIQSGARLADERPAGSWADFEDRLEAKLSGAAAGRSPVGAPFAARRWAWGAAAAGLLAGLAALFLLTRPGPPPAGPLVAAYEGALDPLMLAAEADPDLADRMDREVRAMIDGLTPAADGEAVVLPAADPLFWEALSDDELEAVVSELETEPGRGGPS